MTSSKIYQSPLSNRYASREMSSLFSPQFKFSTWRRLWVALAKAQKQLGLAITDSQIAAMQKNIDNIDLEAAERFEKTVRHDVMAHIHAFAEQCPEAKGIIHLGATSCFVTDNTDLIQMRQGLLILRSKIVQVIRQLNNFASRHAHVSCLSYTHLQPAQPTTVGKRACLWLQDLLIDLSDVEHAMKEVPFLGVKGATGTQASFLTLFHQDHEKVKQLDQLVATEMGFSHSIPISGQTYTRKSDIRILSTLASFAASAHKCATDIRLLAHLKEVEEPFEKTQVGSSAMPYKRNPMHSERICGLARFLISLNENPLYTEATQWLERTLDDSANRRLSIPEAFLTADAIVNLLCNVTAGITIYPKVIEKNLKEELPFLATEQILMHATKKGKDRQDIHEHLRRHSLEASRKMKEEGTSCDLLERIAQDLAIGLSKTEIEEQIHPQNLIGRAPEQTLEFLNDIVAPVLKKHQGIDSHIPNIEL